MRFPSLCRTAGTVGEGGATKHGQRFQRVNVEENLMEIKNSNLLDNSYEGTFGADGWGAKINAKMVQVRGKDFRAAKTKAKRGGYRGGKINTFAVNSFRFDSD
jgi:hypothetical protein